MFLSEPVLHLLGGPQYHRRMLTADTVEIIGVPQDLGQTLRGVDMGPSAIRIAGLRDRLERLGHSVIDQGDIRHETGATVGAASETDMLYVEEIVDIAERLADAVEKAVRAGHFPLVLGGDHSIAMGTMGGLARVVPRQGLIWVDAHADFNTTETSPSGNIHGMPVAAIVGDGDERLVNIAGVTPKVVPEATVLVGLRDVDSEEAERVKASPIRYFTMRDIDEHGMKAVIERAIGIASEGTDGVHLSFDLDAIDPRHAPGTGTPVVGGLTYRESHLMMEILADSKRVTSAEFVEVNPTLDTYNQTAKLVVELVASLAGQTILR